MGGRGSCGESAAGEAIELDQLIEESVAIVSPVLIRHSSDLPAQEAGSEVALLVGLRSEPPPTPGDVVDLDAPSQIGIGSVEVDDHTVAET